MKIKTTDQIVQAVLKKMDELDVKLLVVIDDDLFKSVVSIGDIQRALIKNVVKSNIFVHLKTAVVPKNIHSPTF